MAVDKEGKIIDYMLSEKHDRKSILKFFKKTTGSSGAPKNIKFYKSGSNTDALNSINYLLFLFRLNNSLVVLLEVQR